jgi:polyphosphate kinase 2 (PPK2 family)
MEMNQMFVLATREKYRFPYKGMVSVEDLWDLSVQNLDGIFKVLNSQVKSVQEESLLDTKSFEDKELEAKIEIVKYIVGIKLAEADQRKQARAKSEQKQKIMAILADKQEEELHGKSVEELKAMLDNM